MEYSCADILRTIPKNYTALKFGGLPSVGWTFPGRCSTRDATKLYKSYRVCPGELVVAYLIKAPFRSSIVVDGILVTDNAIYLNPSHCRGKLSNRLPWADLCEFFVAYAGGTSSVSIYRPPDARYTILKTALLDDTSGRELTRFLSEMQQRILEVHPELREKRTNRFQSLLVEYQQMAAAGPLSDSVKAILSLLFAEPAYAEQAVALVAADYAKSHTQSQYLQWIDVLPDNISMALREHLIKTWKSVMDDFSRCMEERSISYDHAYLQDIYNNLGQDTSPTVECTYLRGLICVRLGKWNDFSEIIRILTELQAKSCITSLYIPRLFAANTQMRQVFEKIKADNGSLSKSMLCSSDSMGLTPYHYALIIENQHMLSSLTNSAWPELPENQVFALGDEDIYNYLSLAIYKGLDLEIQKKIAVCMSKELRQIQKRLRSLERRTTFEEVSLVIGGFMLDAATSSGYKDTEEGKEKYERLEKSMSNSPDRIGDLEAQAQETQKEFNEYLFLMLDRAKEKVTQWKQSKDPVIRYLLWLYSDESNLKEVLSTSGTWTLYWKHSFYYMAPEGKIESHKVSTEQKGSDRQIGQESKPYGDSWFSPEAHKSRTVLKSEFAALAKKYHPDTYTSPRATAIFQEISTERTGILELLDK